MTGWLDQGEISKKTLGDFSGKRILMLQGPAGPFFWRLARDLGGVGAHVRKINFNGGDWVFFPSGKPFHGTLDEWPIFFRRALIEWNIDHVFLYGDCRKIHRDVFAVCEALGVSVFTFEEGYLRPDYITFEPGRTNGHSSLPDSPLFYLNLRGLPENAEPEENLGYTFLHQAFFMVLYHAAAFVLMPFFPRARQLYHRGLGIEEAGAQVRSYWRKFWYKLRDRGMAARLTGPLKGRYYLVPLQVAGDSQVEFHSPYGRNGVKKFILEVIQSFASHAPEDTYLVFKHHPLDRGYNDYTGLIRMAARNAGLEGRIFYVHDLPLPALLNAMRGGVLINSTVGLSAISRSKPVKACGKAIYGMKGLVYHGDLDSFWKDAENMRVDEDFFDIFRRYLVSTRLLNGNFYKRCGTSPLACGLIWSRAPGAAETRSGAHMLSRKTNADVKLAAKGRDG